jgi:uncharacterized cupin superfamily protein
MSWIIAIASPQGEADTHAPAPDRIVADAPAFRTVNGYAKESVSAGVWSSSPVARRVAYDEREFCCVGEGVCERTAKGDQTRRFATGDAFVIEPGFRGTFRVVQAMLKTSVILSPETAAKALR